MRKRSSLAHILPWKSVTDSHPTPVDVNCLFEVSRSGTGPGIAIYTRAWPPRRRLDLLGCAHRMLRVFTPPITCAVDLRSNRRGHNDRDHQITLTRNNSAANQDA